MQKNTLQVTTFNIRCFGFNGDYFSKTFQEDRIPFLKKFLIEEFSDTDVFILQEIIDLKILPEILPSGFKFYSYTHDYPRHMHVALCCKQEFVFTDAQPIPHTTIDKTKSRPALYGQLSCSETNTPLAHIVGVHLKSDYNNTNNRIKQCRSISEFLQDKTPPLPTVIAGDFNSHLMERTKKNRNDVFYMDDIFSKLGLKRAITNTHTYVTTEEAALLDHLWTSAKILKSQVYDYTQYSEVQALQNYFSQISDHLPVSVTLEMS